MVVTPSELFNLALSRHRQPWNWTLQFAALGLLCLTLLFHSFLFLAAAVIFFGTGFFQLGLDDPPENGWFRFVAAGVEWEKNWVAAPWNWHKIWRFGFVLLVSAALIWALWVREPAALAIFVGFAVLARVVFENKDGGIVP